MTPRTWLPLAALCVSLTLVGCKKTAAFQVVDADTNQPVPGALIDHYSLYDYTDPRGGQRYLAATTPADAEGWVELKKPQSSDTYLIRATGHQPREVRMTEPGEMAEYMVVGGSAIKEWVEVQPRDEDDEVPTFVIPVEPN